MPCIDFWAKYARVCSNIGNVAMLILLLFSATYTRESGFSTLVSVKTKARNLIVKPTLYCEADMRCAFF